MQKSTLLILLLVTAALGYGVWWSSQQVVEFEEALFPGIESSEVLSVRVDNVARDVQVRIDRDGEGGWKLVDPIEAPADGTMLKTLMEVIDRDRLRLVPGEIDPANFGFEPAQILFQIETRSGEKRSVEIGTVDVAHNTVHLRVRGKIYRAPLRLHTELTHDVASYRRPFAFKTRVSDIGAFHRTGEALGGNHRFGYEIHAILDNDGWRLIAPFEAALLPQAVELLLTNTVRIPVRSYFMGITDPNALGFTPPKRAIEVVELGGDKFVLEIGNGEVGTNFNCRVQPDGDAFQTNADSIYRLEVPLELILDRRLMRAPAELLDRIEIDREEFPTLVLTRIEEGWNVAEGAEGIARLADPRLFDQYFSNLKTILFYDMLETGELEAAEQHAEVRFAGAGENWSVRIGAEYSDEDTVGFRVQRTGDGIVGLLESADAKFLEKRADELRDHRLTRIDELTVSGLILNVAGEPRRWNRDDKGEWTREGRDTEAFEILSLLDPLLHLRAKDFVRGEADLKDPIVVQVLRSAEDATEFRIGITKVDGEDRAVFAGEGEYAVLALDLQDVPKRIEALFTLD